MPEHPAMIAAFMSDPLWRLAVFRLALAAVDEAWADAAALRRNLITAPIAGQLLRAFGSVAANVAEGYSRSSGRDRARFFEYALGSAREGCVWYRSGGGVLGEETVSHRLGRLTDIRRLLPSTIPAERARGRSLGSPAEPRRE